MTTAQSRSWLVAMAFTASCVDEDALDDGLAADTEDPIELRQLVPVEDDGGGGDPPPLMLKTIEGRVFYDDFRDEGRFELRDDPNGATGTQVDFTGSGHNYLAGLDMEIRVWEIDPLDNAFSECEEKDLIATGVVDASGRFELDFNGYDPCDFEPNEAPDLAVQIRLRYCDDVRCISARVDDGDPYSVYYAGASPSSPRQVSGATYDFGTRYFQLSNYDDHARAASMFASLVDSTRRLNVTAGIETALDDEVKLEFPDDVGNANTNGTTIHVPAPDAGEWGGKAVFHEFGHAFHALSWAGSAGTCSTNPTVYDRGGSGSWSATSREWPTTAFNEGVAAFVARAVLDGGPGGCSDAFDPNADPAVAGSPGSPICSADPDEYPAQNVAVSSPNDGKSYVRDVSKLLCDWYDSAGDNDPRMDGAGDHFTATLDSTWRNVAEIYDPNGDCPDICDVVDYYVNVRKSVAAVGQQEHDDYVAAVADLAYQNGLQCGLPNPNTL